MAHIHDLYYLCEAWNKMGQPMHNNDPLALDNVTRLTLLKYMRLGAITYEFN